MSKTNTSKGKKTLGVQNLFTGGVGSVNAGALQIGRKVATKSDIYDTASEKKGVIADELSAQQAQEAEAATLADQEEQRRRSRNSIFQTEGTGGVVTNATSARQSYFGN